MNTKQLRQIVPLAAVAALFCMSSSALGQYMAPGMPPGYGMPPPGMMMPPPSAGMLPAQMYGPMQPVSMGYGAPAPVAPAGHNMSCGDCGTGSCGDCGDCCLDCCSCEGWCHRVAVFAEFLYLRPRDAEVAYGVEVNSVVAPPTPNVQVGPVGVSDFDYQPGWRGGFSYVFDSCSSITAQYTMFEASTDDRLDRTSGIIGSEVQGLVFHPNTLSANSGGIFAESTQDISFDLIDVDYRELLSYGCFHQVTMLLGGRYANLEQQFDMRLPINGEETVLTDIDFDGAGLRLGLEAERYTRRGFMGYAKAHGSLIAGEFRAKYDQGDAFDASVVDTAWEAGRVVPVLDLELGVGWTSANGYWRFSGGYLFSAWYNVVKTDEWINAVQQNNFVDLGNSSDEALTFDGIVARVETRF